MNFVEYFISKTRCKRPSPDMEKYFVNRLNRNRSNSAVVRHFINKRKDWYGFFEYFHPCLAILQKKQSKILM